jgi:hypothetical protein
MRKVIVLALVVAIGLFFILGSIQTARAGQPNQECEDIRPGHSASAPGSAFNPDGVADQHYAGEQPQNSKNPHSVSQYDVACLQVSSH